MENVTRISLLLDFYGKLLPLRQQEAIRLYNEENFSLSEIAELFGISRQGVHDAIKKGEGALKSYEEKLGFLKTMESYSNAVKDLNAIKAQLKEKGLLKLLKDLEEVIDTLDK